MDPTSLLKKIVSKSASSLLKGGQQQQQQSESDQDVQKSLGIVKSLVVKAASVAMPSTITIVAILLVILFFFKDIDTGKAGTGGSEDTTIGTGAGGNTGGSTTPPVGSGVPGLDITLNAKDSVGNGEDIDYSVTISYTQGVSTTSIEQIELYMTIPQGFEFVERSGKTGTTSTPQVVTWPLSDTTNQTTFTFTLRPLPDTKDIILTTSVFGRVVGASGSTGGSGSGTSPSGELGALVAGQGRNATPLGDRAAFISTVISRAGTLSLAGKEDYLGQIFDAGQEYNINPILLLNIWGTENGFLTTFKHYFGCAVYSANPPVGFSEGVSCAADALDFWMKKFERDNVGGSLEISSTTGNTCIYTDAFDYAYEWYAPVCHVNDGNEPAHVNFISFYKQFMGL